MKSTSQKNVYGSVLNLIGEENMVSNERKLPTHIMKFFERAWNGDLYKPYDVQRKTHHLKGSTLRCPFPSSLFLLFIFLVRKRS